MHDALNAQGVYEIVCRDPNGRIKWQVESPNLVALQGANLMLDCAFSNALGGTSFAGLISQTGFQGINLVDTLTSKHWNESTCYTTRPSVVWSIANNGKKIATALQFPVATSDTIVGGFIVFGSSASATTLDSNGSLWSASAFQNGAQQVFTGDTISIQYVATLVHTNANNFVSLTAEVGRAQETTAAIVPHLFGVEITQAVMSASIITNFGPHQLEGGFALDVQIPSIFRAEPIVVEHTEAVSFQILGAVDSPVSHTEISVSANDTSSAFVSDFTTVFNVEQSNSIATVVVLHNNAATVAESSILAATTQNRTLQYIVSRAEGSASAASTQSSIVTGAQGVLESKLSTSNTSSLVVFRPTRVEGGATATSTQNKGVNFPASPTNVTIARETVTPLFLFGPTTREVGVLRINTQTIGVNYAVSIGEGTPAANCIQTGLAAFVKTTAEGSASASSTQNGSVFTVHEVGSALDTPSATLQVSMATTEREPVLSTSTQTVIVNYAVSRAESHAAVETPSAVVASVRSIVEHGTAAETQTVAQRFLVDANGNFVLDASGNRIIVLG